MQAQGLHLLTIYIFHHSQVVSLLFHEMEILIWPYYSAIHRYCIDNTRWHIWDIRHSTQSASSHTPCTSFCHPSKQEYLALTILTTVKQAKWYHVTLKGKHITDVKSRSPKWKGKTKVKFKKRWSKARRKKWQFFKYINNLGESWGMRTETKIKANCCTLKHML